MAATCSSNIKPSDLEHVANDVTWDNLVKQRRRLLGEIINMPHMTPLDLARSVPYH